LQAAVTLFYTTSKAEKSRAPSFGNPTNRDLFGASKSEERAKIELRAGKSLPDMRSPIFVEREAVVWSAKI